MTDRSSLQNASMWLAFAALIVFLPILAFPIPPLVDYPNHFVRIWLEAGGAREAPLSGMYKIDWSLASVNIFIDLVAAMVGPLAGARYVGLMVLSAAVLLPPLGLALLHRSLFGSFSWWNVLGFLLCWNYIFLMGFINFAAGLGLALVAASLESRLHAHRPMVRPAVHFAAGLAMIVVHPFAGLFYCALLGGLAAGSEFGDFCSKAGLASAIRRVFERCWPVGAALVCVVVLGPSLPGAANDSQVVWQGLNPLRLASTLASYFKTYTLWLDAVFVIVFVSLVGAAMRFRCLRWHAGLVAVGFGLSVVSLVMPLMIFGTAAMELRLPAMMVLTFAAALRPDLPNHAFSPRALAGVSLALVLARTADVALVWRAADRDFSAMRSALMSVEAGSSVLAVQYGISRETRGNAPLGRLVGGTQGIFRHYASLAVVDRKAFYPLLFAAPGKQPLRVLAPWTDQAAEEGSPPEVEALLLADGEGYPYLNSWRRNFTYVLLINADMTPAGAPIERVAGLTLLADKGFARLYRIAAK